MKCTSVDLKDLTNGWVIFAQRYLHAATGFVRGFSNTLGSGSAADNDSLLVHQIRTKYIKQFIPAFLKQKEKAIKKNTTLTDLQERAIKQATDYKKLVDAHKAEKRSAAFNKKEREFSAQRRGVSVNNSSGLTLGFDNGSPAAPFNQDTASAPVTASNMKRAPAAALSKRNGYDASLFSPNRDPSTTKRAPAAASQKKTRYADFVSGDAGPDDPSPGGGGDGFDSLLSGLNGFVRKLSQDVPSDGQSRQAVVPAGIHAAVPAGIHAAVPTGKELLMKRLLAKLDRLMQNWERAEKMRRADSAAKYSAEIEAVEKEIADLENPLDDQARDVATAESH